VFFCLCPASRVSIGTWGDYACFSLQIKIDLLTKTVRIIRSLIGFGQAGFAGISEPAAGLANIGRIAGLRHQKTPPGPS
jgi:hypothetical protein